MLYNTFMVKLLIFTFLEQSFYRCFQIFNGFTACTELVLTVDKEKRRHCLDVVCQGYIRVDTLRITHAAPRLIQCGALPEVLIGIERDLIDFKSLGSILVIEVAQQVVV